MPYQTHLKARQRLHSWLADRIPWLQYPEIRPIHVPERPAFFKHAMPAEVRIGLFFFGVVVLLLCAVVLTLIVVALSSLFRQ